MPDKCQEYLTDFENESSDPNNVTVSLLHNSPPQDSKCQSKEVNFQNKNALALQTVEYFLFAFMRRCRLFRSNPDAQVIPLGNSFSKEKSKDKNEDVPLKSRRQRFREFCKTFVVEPFMYSFVFSMQLRSVTHQNLLLQKACLVDLNYSNEVCLNIHHPDNVEAKNNVQKFGNDLHMYAMVLAIVPSALCTIILGPWSDKYSRKYPIIFSTIGVLLDIVILIIYSVDFHSPAVNVLIASVPAGLGGIMVVITCIYSYLSEITTPENRLFRYAILDLGFLFAGPMGSALGGIIFEYYGYVAVFTTSLVAQLLGLIFLMVRMEDPKHKNLTDWKVALRDLFSLESIKDSIRTTLKKREGNVRKEIWLLFLSMCCIIACFLGTISVGFLHAQKMYNWSVAKYSIVFTLVTVSHGIAMMIFIPIFTKIIHLTDVILVIIGVLAMLAQNVVKGFAFQEWVYYLAAVLGLLSSIGSIAVRSRLSKIVAKEELGRVFSVLALTESLTPVVGIIIFAQIYGATISFFPGLVFEVAAAFLIIPIVVCIWVHKTSKSTEIKETEEKPVEDEIKMEHVF